MDIKKEIRLSVFSKLEDGTAVCSFRGTIKTDDPDNITYISSILNQNLYRKNREKVKANQKRFEDALYIEKDRMMTSTEKETVRE